MATSSPWKLLKQVSRAAESCSVCTNPLWVKAANRTGRLLKKTCNSLHDGIEVLRGHASLWVRQATDDIREQVVDRIVLIGNTKNKVKNLPNYSGSIKGSGYVCVYVCPRTHTCTLVASSLKKFTARLVMWGSGSISSTATSLTWPLTLSTSLSTNCVRTVTAVCLTEETSSLSLQETRMWNYWLIFATFSFIRMTVSIC